MSETNDEILFPLLPERMAGSTLIIKWRLSVMFPGDVFAGMWVDTLLRFAKARQIAALP